MDEPEPAAEAVVDQPEPAAEAVVDEREPVVSVDPMDTTDAGQPGAEYRTILVVGSVMLVALGATAGWLGYQTFTAQHVNAERNAYVQAARQAALNLTTIDYTHAEADVQRVIDSATGEFRDGFSERAQPFIDTVKRAQSRSVGTITEAGLESMHDGQAQAIVAVSVTTKNVTGAEEAPKAWRMRLGMETVGDSVKVSQVEFVQ